LVLYQGTALAGPQRARMTTGFSPRNSISQMRMGMIT
jgi:hypothetical protein